MREREREMLLTSNEAMRLAELLRLGANDFVRGPLLALAAAW